MVKRKKIEKTIQKGIRKCNQLSYFPRDMSSLVDLLFVQSYPNRIGRKPGGRKLDARSSLHEACHRTFGSIDHIIQK